MDECKTLDELIAALEKKREALGGETRVLYAHAFTGDVSVPRVGRARTGKGQPFKLVTRGGEPVVTLNF